MDMVFVLLPLSILLAVCGVIGYLWATRSGQYDDLETPAVRVLFEEEDSGRNGVGSKNGDKGSPTDGGAA